MPSILNHLAGITSAVVHSKAVFLLLFIHCLLLFAICVGACGVSLFWYALLCVLPCFAIDPPDEERASRFTFIFLYMSCRCCYSLPLPHSAMDWSVACDCGISCHAQLHL